MHIATQVESADRATNAAPQPAGSLGAAGRITGIPTGPE